MKKLNLTAMIGALVVSSLSGCCTNRDKEAQLERVAKDWCLTIRASQVIPVYPLTEDIQPGDIFLVQVPIGRQQEIYREKGFLPLDNHLKRLNPGGYAKFYRNSFLHENPDDAVLPYDWIRPGGTFSNAWSTAPRAAFPSYSFSIRSGEGLNLAVPIQGVPVGLSLMNSDAADGSVSIKDGRTLGVDVYSLYQELKKWSSSRRDFLTNYAAVNGGSTNYLRAVTRVYATGKIDVSLRDASAKSGGLDVGAAKPVNLLFPELPKNQKDVTSATAQNYTNGLAVINAGLLSSLAKDAAGNFLPGGSVRVTAASSRTISLQEDFDPPLVIGYLGFDCMILSDGTIGNPIPTYANLNPKFKVQSALVQKYNSTFKAQSAVFDEIKKRYEAANDEQKAQIRSWAVQEKLTACDEAAAWTQKLSMMVDGSDIRQLDKFQSLLNKLKTLK